MLFGQEVCKDQIDSSDRCMKPDYFEGLKTNIYHYGVVLKKNLRQFQTILCYHNLIRRNYFMPS